MARRLDRTLRRIPDYAAEILSVAGLILLVVCVAAYDLRAGGILFAVLLIVAGWMLTDEDEVPDDGR